MAISDLPGYVQGFVFSDASSATYAAGVFKNQGPTGSGFGGIGDCTITAGTPTFATTNGKRGIILDNTVQGGFIHALPWECAIITIMKPNMTVNGTIYPFIFGGAVSVASNGSIRLTRTPSYLHRAATPSAVLLPSEDYAASDALKVTAFEFSQETRRSYSTRDGVTVTASAAVADNNHGNGIAIGSANVVGPGNIRARFGNLSGTAGDFAASTNTCEMYEAHFIRAKLLRDAGYLALLAAEITASRAEYGV